MFILSSDKYSSQFGGGSQYAYFHEEDETSFQLVDTAKTQKTAYQRNRMRFAQVPQTLWMTPLNVLIQVFQNVCVLDYIFITWCLFQQRNLRRDKDRRNLTQFNMQTLPKSAKQKERWDSVSALRSGPVLADLLTSVSAFGLHTRGGGAGHVVKTSV